MKPMLSPVAARALAVSWAASPATALNAIPVAAQPRPNAREPLAGSPPAASAAADEQPEHHVGAEADGEGGRQRSVAAQPSAAEQFQASALLVAAGVPDDEDHHEDGEDGGHECGVFDQREGADGGGIVDPSEQGHHRGGRVQGGGGLDAARHVRVQLGAGQRRRVGNQGEARNPERQQPAVPPQSEPDQDARAGQGLRHRRTAAADSEADAAGPRCQGPRRRRRCSAELVVAQEQVLQRRRLAGQRVQARGRSARAGTVPGRRAQPGR